MPIEGGNWGNAVQTVFQRYRFGDVVGFALVLVSTAAIISLVVLIVVKSMALGSK